MEDIEQSEAAEPKPESERQKRRSRASTQGRIDKILFDMEAAARKNAKPAIANMLVSQLEALREKRNQEREDAHDATLQENAALKQQCEADTQRIAELESENRALTTKNEVKNIERTDPDGIRIRHENRSLHDALKTIVARMDIEERARLAVRSHSSLKEVWAILDLPFDYQTCGQLMTDPNYRTEKSLLELVQRCPVGSQLSVFAKAALAEKFNTIVTTKEPRPEVLSVEEQLEAVNARLARARREADERMREQEAEKFRRETLAGPRGLGGSDRGVAVEWRNVQTVPSPIKREPVGSSFAEWV
jgi:hypothetical protein